MQRASQVDETQAGRVVRVGEDAGRAALLVDGVVQSISPQDSLADGGYWAAMVPDERPHSALILGLGGGTLAGLLRGRWGEVRIIGVDDDRAILDTAAAAGWLMPNRVEVVVADAFDYVQACQERFAYIAVDLFRGERVVRRALGKPFLRRLRGLLEPRGRLAINIFLDHHSSERIERIGALFELRERLQVGGNVVVHARRRRR